MQSKKNAELSKDSLLRRQVETQDLLLRKASVLDTMNLEHKSNNSIIKEEIQKIRDNYEKIILSMNTGMDASYEGIKSINIYDWLIAE